MYSQLHIDQPFELEAGEVLPFLDIGYHVYGDIHHNRPVTWIFHAMTGNSDPMDWWSGMVGAGKAFDPNKQTIVCANVLGSCYGTTGPLSMNPKTKKPWLTSFPLVTIRDMVKAHELLRKHLGINHINLAVGGSLGAIQALEWSIMNPKLIRHMAFIAAGARTSPWTKAFNEAQRMALMADPSFFSDNPDGGKDGLKAARAMGMVSYRSFEAFEKTQADPENHAIDNFRASSYQRYQGEKLARRYNAHAYFTITKALDSHDAGRGRGGVQNALWGIKHTRVHCISIRTDILFPILEVQQVADMIPGATHQTIDSLYGHDGFLVEADTLTKIVESWDCF